jgi:2'-5' RNA ligase
VASEAWRCFLALPVPGTAAARLDADLREVRERHGMARWIPAEHLHVTLVFLGATDRASVPSAAEGATRVATRHAPIDIALDGASGRARRDGEGIGWLRVGEGAAGIAALAADLRAELARVPALAADAAAPEAGRRPHVTVARRVSASLLAELEARPSADTVRWRADEVVLFRSHLGPPGARYEPLHRAPLGR